MKKNPLPIEFQTKPILTTAEAAYYLNRKEQTLRGWSCYGGGPIEPVRIAYRLGWKTSDVKRLVGITDTLSEGQQQEGV